MLEDIYGTGAPVHAWLNFWEEADGYKPGLAKGFQSLQESALEGSSANINPDGSVTVNDLLQKNEEFDNPHILDDHIAALAEAAGLGPIKGKVGKPQPAGGLVATPEQHLKAAIKNILVQEYPSMTGPDGAMEMNGILDGLMFLITNPEGDNGTNWEDLTADMTPVSEQALHNVAQTYMAGGFENLSSLSHPAVKKQYAEYEKSIAPTYRPVFDSSIPMISDEDFISGIDMQNMDPRLYDLMYDEGYLDEERPPQGRRPLVEAAGIPNTDIAFARLGPDTNWRKEGYATLRRLAEEHNIPPEAAVPWEMVQSGLQKDAEKYHIPAYQALFSDLDQMRERHPGIHEAFLLRDMQKAYEARIAQLRSRGISSPERFVHAVDTNRTFSTDLTDEQVVRYLRLHNEPLMAAPHWVVTDSGYSGTIPERIISALKDQGIRKKIDVQMLSSNRYSGWQSPSVLDLSIPRGDIVKRIEHSPHRRGTIPQGYINSYTLQPWGAPVTAYEGAMTRALEQAIVAPFRNEYIPFRAPRVYAEPKSLPTRLAEVAQSLYQTRQSAPTPGFPDLLNYAGDAEDFGDFRWYDLDGGKSVVDVSNWQMHPDYTAPHSTENPAVVLQHPETGAPYFVKSTRSPIREALATNLYGATGLPAVSPVLATGMMGAKHQQQIMTPYLPGMATLKELVNRGAYWSDAPSVDVLPSIGPDSWLLNRSQHGKQFLLPKDFDIRGDISTIPTHIDFGEAFSNSLPWAAEAWWNEMPSSKGNAYNAITKELLDKKLTRSNFFDVGRSQLINSTPAKVAETLELPSTIPAPLIYSLVQNAGFSPSMADQLVRRAQAMAGTAGRVRQLPGATAGLAGLSALAMLAQPAEASDGREQPQAAGDIPQPLLYSAAGALATLDPKDWWGGMKPVERASLEDQVRLYRAGAGKLPTQPGSLGAGFKFDPSMRLINPPPTFGQGMRNLVGGAWNRVSQGLTNNRINGGLMALDLLVNQDHYLNYLRGGSSDPYTGQEIPPGDPQRMGPIQRLTAPIMANEDARQEDWLSRLQSISDENAREKWLSAEALARYTQAHLPQYDFDFGRSSGGSW